MPFSSIAMSRSSANKMFGKKNSKFNFLNKLRKSKDNKETVIEEMKEENIDSNKKDGQKKENNRNFNEVFDTRASNPIHVNNLKLEFGIKMNNQIIEL